MSFVVRLSNLIEKVRETDLPDETFGETWTDWVNGELAESNANNAKNLGGRPRSTMDDEDESNQFDYNMEKIMSRFNTFNSLMSNSSNADEEEEDEGEGEAQEDFDLPKRGSDIPDMSGERPGTPMVPESRCEVDIPGETKVDSRYADASYWKVSGLESNSLEDLLADYQ